MLDLNYTTFQGLCSAFIFKNVGLMALNILTVYALKLSTFLYQHFPYVFSVTTEEGSLFYEMPKSLHALRLIPSYLFRDCAPLIFSAKPQFLMTISMEFSNYGKKKKKSGTQRISLVQSFNPLLLSLCTSYYIQSVCPSNACFLLLVSWT